jgi:hypothetical protein
MQSYQQGDHAAAVDRWLTGVFAPGCRQLLDHIFPGSWEQAVQDADTFFGIEVPELQRWQFGTAEARRISVPVLSVVGGESDPAFFEMEELLRVVPTAGVGAHVRPQPFCSACESQRLSQTPWPSSLPIGAETLKRLVNHRRSPSPNVKDCGFVAVDRAEGALNLGRERVSVGQGKPAPVRALRPQGAELGLQGSARRSVFPDPSGSPPTLPAGRTPRPKPPARW